MKNTFLLMAWITLLCSTAFGDICSHEQILRGCTNQTWQHCYPKTGDCWQSSTCRCGQEIPFPPSSDSPLLMSGKMSDSGFNGVKCGPVSPRAMTRTCCVYTNGVIVSCSDQAEVTP